MKSYLTVATTVCALLSIPTISTAQSETQPGYRASLYDTAWPADMANLNRSNSVVNAGFPRGTLSKDVVIETVEMPYPAFAYTKDDDEIFVLGGTPLALDKFVSQMDGMPQGETKADPHLTKYIPSSGELIRLDLNLGKTVPYIGGALVHANGYIYVVSQAHLYKIDTDSMTIAKSADLPTVPAPNEETTSYNGLATSSNGNLLTKFFALGGGEGEGASDSIFLQIDPDTLEVVSSVNYPGASPRLAVDQDAQGNEHLYHLNPSITYRFLIEEDSLTLDENWITRFDPYNTGNDINDEPTSPVIHNGRVHYTTNTIFSSPGAMKIFWQETNTAYTKDAPPLTGPYLFDESAKNGWSFFHLSIDEVTGIVIGNDQGNGLLVALKIDGDGNVTELWKKNLQVSVRPAIVSDRKMVYATDFVNGNNDLVVLDLETGEELIRKSTPATRKSVSTIVVTSSNEVFFGSNEPGQPTGLFHRFYVSPSD